MTCNIAIDVYNWLFAFWLQFPLQHLTRGHCVKNFLGINSIYVKIYNFIAQIVIIFNYDITLEMINIITKTLKRLESQLNLV